MNSFPVALSLTIHWFAYTSGRISRVFPALCALLLVVGGHAGGEGWKGKNLLVIVHHGHRDFRQQALNGFDKTIAVRAGIAADEMDGIGLPRMNGYREGGAVVEINGNSELSN